MLKGMSVMHPAAKMLVDLSAAQDVEAGDGTTSVVVIAGSLLGAADRLLAKGAGLHSELLQCLITEVHTQRRNTSHGDLRSFPACRCGGRKDSYRHVTPNLPLRPTYSPSSRVHLAIIENSLTTLKSPRPYGSRCRTQNHRSENCRQC